MYAFDKNSVSAEVLQNHFAEAKNGFGKHVEIYIDDSKTGEAVACAVICGLEISLRACVCQTNLACTPQNSLQLEWLSNLFAD